MASQSNRNKLSRFFEKMLKERDKYQSVLLKVSEFGLIQMTRKRSGKTLTQQLMNACPLCKTRGYIKSYGTIAHEILKQFQDEVERKKIKGDSLSLYVSQPIFDYLVNNEFQSLIALEKKLGRKIVLESKEKFELSQFSLN